MNRPRLAVLGAGSWGTTVASVAAGNTEVTLWGRDPEQAAEIERDHRNRRYLCDRPLSSRLHGTADLGRALDRAGVVVFGVPSRALRDTARAVAPLVTPGTPLVSLAKGLEPGSRLRPSEVLAAEMPACPVAVLSGPNIAAEVLDGMAAAAVLATDDEGTAKELQDLLRSDRFRIYRGADVVGAEMGGVLKNVVAIATGMAEGLGVGDNTKAMVICRGLAEITRLGTAMGGDPATFSGLTGVGDLIATCSSPLSRNRRVGVELGRGRAIDDIVGEMNQVAEGVRTVGIVMDLAAEHSVDVPIAAEVHAVINQGRSAAEAYRGLRRIAPQSEGHAVA